MPPSIAVVFLHGSGDSGPGIRKYLEVLQLERYGFKTFRQVADEGRISIFTPTSKAINYTPAFGQTMNVWFDRSSDFMSLGINDPHEDSAGAQDSIRGIMPLLKELEESYDFLFIGGFSMGGCLALHLLREPLLPSNVKGIFSLSSFLVSNSAVFTVAEDIPSTIPILMMHGTHDTMIQFPWGQATGTSLLLRGAEVQFRAYDLLDHEICGEELSDLLGWMDDNVNIHSVAAPGESIAKKAAEINRELYVAAHTQSIPYTIEKMKDENKYIIYFPCSSEIIEILVRSQVLARGSYFDILPAEDRKGVKTLVSTVDPEGLALAIGKRLLIRLQSGGTDFNPCPMS